MGSMARPELFARLEPARDPALTARGVEVGLTVLVQFRPRTSEGPFPTDPGNGPSGSLRARHRALPGDSVRVITT